MTESPGDWAYPRARESREAPLALEQLTGRELDVLLAAARGATARESARLFGISHRTVESHRLAAYRKLGVHSALGVVPFLASAGLLGGGLEPLAKSAAV